ncbi:oxysterol-binding protein 1-like [Brevipalpus obovatus]|uniref:oxysterol-binding protein 1-like n=1 Tax=Brevipalpus obovatus TaxID=246614 RepID=UPI003D9EE9FD
MSSGESEINEYKFEVPIPNQISDNNNHALVQSDSCQTSDSDHSDVEISPIENGKDKKAEKKSSSKRSKKHKKHRKHYRSSRSMSDEERESLIAIVKVESEKSDVVGQGTSDGPKKLLPEVLNNFSPPTLDPERRTSIPDKPSCGLSMWSLLKNCIGSDLTRIPMPVYFNEPLSMLQRMTEDFEYAHLLDLAATIEDSCDQLVLIAAFAMSTYSTTSTRTGKPFNPLLGETFECDRTTDLGWKSVSEQVSHHPPISAIHCRGEGWVCICEQELNSKFRGKYLRVDPIWSSHLELSKQGFHYSWNKVTTTAHNVLIGKLWVEHHGDMHIINHTTGDRCLLRFLPYSFFSNEPLRKVYGSIIDNLGNLKWVFQGFWDRYLKAYRVRSSHKKPNKLKISCTASKGLTVWRKNIPPECYSTMYNMTPFAVQLNEPEDGVAPTDSRLRPDQRAMEDGDWDKANDLKSELEENQRHRKVASERIAKANGQPHENKPIWFKKAFDPITQKRIHIFTDEYWQCKAESDWSKCPCIYQL